MKVCATTERQESTMFDLPRSNTKFGFLIRFTQNLQNRPSEKNLLKKPQKFFSLLQKF